MKIVHLTYGRLNPESANGVNYVVLNLARAQIAAGNDVCALALSPRDSEVLNMDRNAVPVTLIPDPARFPRRATLLWRHLDALRSAGRVDVVHVHLAWHPQKAIAAAWCRRVNVPYVVTTHAGYTPDRVAYHGIRKRIGWTLWERGFLNGAAAIHVICKEEISDLRSLGVTAPVFQAYNGINWTQLPKKRDRAHLRARLGLAPDRVLMVYVGRVAPEKNLEGLVRALGLVRKAGCEPPDLVIIGPADPSARERVLALAEAVGVAERVHLVGALFGPEKYDAMASADFYAHPAWSDVVSIAVMEALACGLPAVVTRSSYVSYVWDRAAFEMVEPWPDDIATGIIRLLGRRGEWEKMGQAGRELALREFSWKRSSETIVAEYVRVLSSRGQSR